PPPSTLTSTSAVELGNARYSVSKLSTAELTPDRSAAGVVSTVSCVLFGPRKSLSTMAKVPVPPVWLPRGFGSSDFQPPASLASVTVQPGGASVVSNVSVCPVVCGRYPGASQASTSTGTATLRTTSAAPSGTVCVTAW